MSDELIVKVKQMIIDSLRIEGMSPDEIDTDAPLFGDGLGLDSIDALQLVPPVRLSLPPCGVWLPISRKTVNESAVCLPGLAQGEIVGGTGVQVSLPLTCCHRRRNSA